MSFRSRVVRNLLEARHVVMGRRPDEVVFESHRFRTGLVEDRARRGRRMTRVLGPRRPRGRREVLAGLARSPDSRRVCTKRGCRYSKREAAHHRDNNTPLLRGPPPIGQCPARYDYGPAPAMDCPYRRRPGAGPIRKAFSPAVSRCLAGCDELHCQITPGLICKNAQRAEGLGECLAVRPNGQPVQNARSGRRRALQMCRDALAHNGCLSRVRHARSVAGRSVRVHWVGAEPSAWLSRCALSRSPRFAAASADGGAGPRALRARPVRAGTAPWG